MSDHITAILARQVLDSRGQPTVEVEVHGQEHVWGRAIVPCGASTGKHEARELRDGNPAAYAGKSVHQAVRHVQEVLAPALIGMPASEQKAIDERLCELDGTSDKSRLGANAILGVSLACAHAAASARRQPLWQYLDPGGHARLPLPMVNLISGGLHAGKNLEVQDFLFLPIRARSYSEALHMTVNVYRALSVTLQEQHHEGVLVGDEGGFGPRLRSNEEAIEIILQAYQRTGLVPGHDAALALDVASTHFYERGSYRLQHRCMSAPEMVALYLEWTRHYPILSIEDGMAEDDWEGWKSLTDALGQNVQLIGDDLFVTHALRLARGVEDGIANSILIKLNQIGTLTETLQVIEQARQAGYRTIVSARSGETEDCTIADLAVATGAGQIKIGSVARSERLAKYNQLLRIEEQMGPQAPFAAWEDLQGRWLGSPKANR